ncbi:tetratricopeptide repeat protein [uncultured Maribacter sp.]|uniref:tetratricopeptide repeat protein n=1 Tax=uncultured Maribacter sp. TaxID=431308 RepID=UPI0026162173|nr:tetratricopeptide repeat protein [uncultured Maribacter sp.]
MKTFTYILIFLLFQINVFGQQNCETLKDDPKCYQACLTMNQESMHHQGSYASQKHLSDAIEMCPTLSNAYFEKSVAFLKRGMFIEWKELMDKAVEINPEQHLSYRAWCQFSFLHNYEETIKDLNTLTEIKGTPFIGVGQSGDYDLRIVLALSYKLTNRKDKAIEIIETAMMDKDYYVGLYDYLHLGVIYLENNEPDKALESFKKQIEENELAEVYFYLGKTYLKLKNPSEASKNIQKALEMYKNGRKMHSNYYQFTDQIYQRDILDLQNITG